MTDSLAVVNPDELKKLLEKIKSGTDIRKIPKEFLANKKVAIALIKEDPHNLDYLSFTLKDDKDIVMMAVQQNGWTIKYASLKLKADVDLALVAVRDSGHSLEYIQTEFGNKKKVVLEAVKQSGSSFQYASKRLKKDFDIVLAAVTENGNALRWADSSFKENQNFINLVLDSNEKDDNYSHEVLRFSSEDIKNDFNTVKKAVQRNIRSIEHASEEKQKDVNLYPIILEKDICYAGSFIYDVFTDYQDFLNQLSIKIKSLDSSFLLNCIKNMDEKEDPISEFSPQSEQKFIFNEIISSLNEKDIKYQPKSPFIKSLFSEEGFRRKVLSTELKNPIKSPLKKNRRIW